MALQETVQDLLDILDEVESFHDDIASLSKEQGNKIVKRQ